MILHGPFCTIEAKKICNYEFNGTDPYFLGKVILIVQSFGLFHINSSK